MERLEKKEKLSYLASQCQKYNLIDVNLYSEYDVKRGLRDLNGTGVLAGLTTISTIYPEKSLLASQLKLVASCVIAELTSTS